MEACSAVGKKIRPSVFVSRYSRNSNDGILWEKRLNERKDLKVFVHLVFRVGREYALKKPWTLKRNSVIRQKLVYRDLHKCWSKTPSLKCWWLSNLSETRSWFLRTIFDGPNCCSEFSIIKYKIIYQAASIRKQTQNLRSENDFTIDLIGAAISGWGVREKGLLFERGNNWTPLWLKFKFRRSHKKSGLKKLLSNKCGKETL